MYQYTSEHIYSEEAKISRKLEQHSRVVPHVPLTRKMGQPKDLRGKHKTALQLVCDQQIGEYVRPTKHWQSAICLWEVSFPRASSCDAIKAIPMDAHLCWYKFFLPGYMLPVHWLKQLYPSTKKKTYVHSIQKDIPYQTEAPLVVPPLMRAKPGLKFMWRHRFGYQNLWSYTF